MRDTKRSDSILKMPVLAYFPQEVLKSAYKSVGRRDGLICCQPQQMMSFQDFTAISKLIFS